MALLIVAITLAVAARTFDGYLERSSAKRAAEIFSQDLSVTKNAALRSREDVVMEFDEANLEYLVRIGEGDTILHRFFHEGQDPALSFMDLELSGDSLVFDASGVAELGGAPGALARMVFKAGTTSYAVSFNSMGLARVDGI